MKERIKRILPKGWRLFLEDRIGRFNLGLEHLRERRNLGGGKVELRGRCQFENKVFAARNVTFENVSVGKDCYIREDCKISYCDIGRYCSIAGGTKIGLAAHPINFVSTYPKFCSVSGKLGGYADKNYFPGRSRVLVGNDVWIGENVLIKDGVKVGNGAIIGAGAVVVKDVEPYSIVGGVPAKRIRYRFSKKEIEFLEKSKWWEKDDEWLRKNWKLFLDVKEFMKKFN